MVGFIPAGRCGNFFFECANAWAYAKRYGLDFTVPFFTSSEVWSPIYLKHLQNSNYNKSLPTITIKEKQFHYSPIPFSEQWRSKNIIFSGYFQSYLYFDEYREELLKAFALPYEIKKDTCSLHCRYGDYLTIQGKHIVVDERYILEAMSLITDYTGIIKFKVFSDDLGLFKQRHGSLYNFEYSTNSNELDDLVEISCCHSNINSSSTFSWWGAWLNQNTDKVIVTDHRWFQYGWDNADTKDILMPEWIKI